MRGSASWEARRAEIYEAARDAVLSDTASNGADKVVSTLGRGSTSENGGRSTAWRQAFAANYQEAETASQDQEYYRARSDAARELASQIEREGSTFTMNWDNAFLDHMASQDRGDGYPVGMAEASRRWTSSELQDQMWVEGEARSFIGSQADHLLERPELSGWRAPSDTPSFLRDNHQVEGHGSPVFDEARADQIEGTQEWTGRRHEMSIARQQGDEEELARLRKLTVQSRVQDSRDREWDEFARGEPDRMSTEEANIWRKSKRFPGIGGAQTNGEKQRMEEERMPDRQSFGGALNTHLETGADRIDQN